LRKQPLFIAAPAMASGDGNAMEDLPSRRRTRSLTLPTIFGAPNLELCDAEGDVTTLVLGEESLLNRVQLTKSAALFSHLLQSFTKHQT
jgi:hypothetical protein